MWLLDVENSISRVPESAVSFGMESRPGTEWAGRGVVASLSESPRWCWNSQRCWLLAGCLL